MATLSDFGAKLRDARERRGVSLRQIANSTKISITTLEALERNDIARLPGGIFTRAFVRAYAAEVGLDPDRTIREFMAQFPQEAVTVGQPASTPHEQISAWADDRVGVRSAFFKLLAVSIPAAVLIFYFGTNRPQPESTNAKTSTALAAAEPSAGSANAGGAEVSEGAATSAAAVPSGASVAPTAGTGTPAIVPASSTLGPASALDAPNAPLSVTLASTGRCWVSVVVDGQRALQRELQAGESQAFAVHETFVVRAGNAGALSMTLNGAPGKPLGRPGEVVTTRLNLTNFKNYLAGP